MKQRSDFHCAVILCARLCIAQQKMSIGVNVVNEGSPSRILRVLRISLGITIRPRSSTLLTMPVAFIYLSPLQMLQTPKAPLCKGGWQKSLISARGIVIVDTLQSLRHGLRRATSLCTREAFRTYNNFTNYAVSICKQGKIIRI